MAKNLTVGLGNLNSSRPRLDLFLCASAFLPLSIGYDERTSVRPFCPKNAMFATVASKMKIT
jgi:hypothetical protein